MKKSVFCALLAVLSALLFACAPKGDVLPYEEDHECVYGNAYVSVAPTCRSEGVRVRYCKICHRELTETFADETAHVFDDTVIPPAEKDGGYTVRNCTVCGYHVDRANEVPALYALVETAETEKGAPAGTAALLVSDAETHLLRVAANTNALVPAASARALALALTVGEAVTEGALDEENINTVAAYFDGNRSAAAAVAGEMGLSESELLLRVNARLDRLGVAYRPATLTGVEIGGATLADTAVLLARVLDEPTARAAAAAALPAYAKNSVKDKELLVKLADGNLLLLATKDENETLFTVSLSSGN